MKTQAQLKNNFGSSRLTKQERKQIKQARRFNKVNGKASYSGNLDIVEQKLTPDFVEFADNLLFGKEA